MDANASGVNAHAAMTPELMRDIRQRVQGMRQWVGMSWLEDDKRRPNLIRTGSASGSSSNRSSRRQSGAFVKQQQAAFLRSTSQTSSQSSLNSPPKSNRSSLRSLTTTSPLRGDSSENGHHTTTTTTTPINLPRIPSKTLKDRSSIKGGGEASRNGDVAKRSGPETWAEEEGVRKVRRLSSSRGSQRSSLSMSSPVSSPDRDRAAGEEETFNEAVVLRRKVQQNSSSSTTLVRQNAVSSSSLESSKGGSRPSSGGGGGLSGQQQQPVSGSVGVSNSRPSSGTFSAGKQIASAGSSRPASSRSSHSERRGGSSTAASSTPRGGSGDGEAALLLGRKGSSASERSVGGEAGHGQGGVKVGKEEGDGDRDRHSAGTGGSGDHHQTSSPPSRRGSSKGSRSSSKGHGQHRPSFHTIQGSSTPVLHRHSLNSSVASSASSSTPPPPALPPAPPIDMDSLPNTLDLEPALPPPPSPPPPPPMRSTSSSSPPPPLTLPSPPPTPPPSSPPPLTPPPPPPVTEGEEGRVADSHAPSLFQPRPPSTLSAHPLPTPPPTPKSATSPPSGAHSSASSSSSTTTTPRAGDQPEAHQPDTDFFSFLPDSLPHDDIGEGRHSIKFTAEAQDGRQQKEEDETDGTSAVQNASRDVTGDVTDAKLWTEGEERTWASIKTTTSTEITSSGLVQKEKEKESGSGVKGEKNENKTAHPPVLHFPPPPDYSPPNSPTLQSPTCASTSTSLLSPTSPPFSAGTVGSSGWGDSDHRLTSTSTDVVLGYLDNALEPYASAPPTPAPLRSPTPLTASQLPDVHHDQHTSPPPTPSVDPSTGAPPTRIPTIVMDSDPSSSTATSTKTLPTTESQAQKETPLEVMSSFLNVERLHIEKKKSGKKSKRKTTPTQVTKYEGSVKTVRRQIKPGHVGELREMFLQQEDDDDDVTVRHGKRRMSRMLRSDSSDDDRDFDAKSGYTTNSSDNEYDLEEAEKINSPDYDSSSPFAPARTAGYTLNWEAAEKSSTSLHTSSGGSTPKAKKSGDGFVFEKDLPPLSAPDAAFTDLTAQTASQRGLHEAEKTPPTTPTTSLHARSIPPHSPITKNADSLSAPLLPSLGMQQSEHKSDSAIHVEVGKAEKEDASNAFATTSLFSTAPALKTRSSSSESELDERDKGDHHSDFLSSSVDSKKDFPPALEKQKTTAQHALTSTSFLQGDRSALPSQHDSGSVAPERGALLTDRHLMMDAHYSGVGDSPSPSAKVIGGLGVTEEVEITTEREESGAVTALEGEREDPMTIFRPNDYNQNDRTWGTGEESEGLTTVLHVGSNAHDFPVARSSMVSGPEEVVGGDSTITHSVTARGAGPSGRAAESPSLGQSSSHTLSHTPRQSAVTPPHSPDSQDKPETGADGGATDFLSILDDIQLGSDGYTLSADTAQRARQLQTEQFRKDNRNSVEVSATDAVHTVNTETVLFSSDAHSAKEDLPPTAPVLNGESTEVEKTSAPDVSSQQVDSTEESSEKGPSVESHGYSQSFTSELKLSPSSPPPPTLSTYVNVHETNDSDVTRALAAPSSDDTPENVGAQDKVTAAVNGQSSFTVEKKATDVSHSQQNSISSRASSSSSLSSQAGADNEAMFSPSQANGQDGGEVYVYRDSRGDVFVMQDITDQTETQATTEPTTAFVRTASDGVASRGASDDLRGLSLNDSVQVDTQQVDVKKAKEVISAFFTDGTSATPVERQKPSRQQSITRMGDDRYAFLRSSMDGDSEFQVVAGNLGMGGRGQAHNSALRRTPSSGDQHRRESVTVSTTSTAVLKEEAELQIHIPRNAVPVLPIPPRRLNSRETSSDISPMVADTPFSPQLTSVSEPHSYSSHAFSPSSSFDPRTVYDSQTSDGNRLFTSQRTLDRVTQGRTMQDFESESGMGDHTYTSQTTLERSFPGSGSEDRANRAKSVRVSRLRKTSGSSLSSEEDHGSKARYMVTRLARTDSDSRNDRSYSTDSTLKSSRQMLGSGRIYDSAASLPSYGRPSQVTFTDNAPTFHTNISFGEEDSQYGSQTSKATSAGDMSPTDEQLYRIVRADKSSASPTSPTRPTVPHTDHHQQVVQRTLDRKTRATTDYQQRELNSSQEAIFRQNTGSNHMPGLWRVNRFSPSEPQLSQPVMNRSFTTLPRREEEARSQKYRVVKSGYNGQKVQTSSSESDDDSGVDGGKRYRLVSRVQVQGLGAKKRSNSTGSLKNAELSLLPRSPPPSSHDYRVSQVRPHAEWEQQRVRSEVTAGNMYRVSRVLSSEDLPQDVQQAASRAVRQPWSSVQDVGDENNNKHRPYRVLHTLPTEKASTLDDHVFRKREAPRLHAAPQKSRPRDLHSRSFDSSWFHRSSRPTSPPPRSHSPGPGERHRTVINLRVGDNKILPTTHYTETEGQQYRVVNVKSSDNPAASSVYPDHNHSISSPVSGYESDVERSTSSSNLVHYRVTSPLQTQQHQQQQQRLPTSPQADPASSQEGGRRYIVNSTQSSSTLQDGITVRTDRPRATSPPPQQSPTGEWHKTTIDIRRNPGKNSGGRPQSMLAPSQQQQSKSYVVFNSSENIHDDSTRSQILTTTTSAPPLLRRSHSPPPSFTTSERQYRVTSPTPTLSSLPTQPPYRGFLSGDFYPDPPSTRTPPTRETPISSRHTLLPRPVTEDDEGQSYSQEIYEEKTYEVRQDGGGHVMPESPQPLTDEEKDLRVLRGKILIQNRLDDSRDHAADLLENMNVFDSSFHLGKDNPLYQSDPDIYKALEAELQEQEQRSKSIGQEVTQDITWETVDRIAKRHQSGDVELSPKPRRKQNLSTMLLSKLASIDSKDLRQHIDVQHHHEEIYGDVHLVHADGSAAQSRDTSNFDSVNENVELMLKKGKAFVIIKVIAERIVPIDYEFNVWRKSQAIVTRNIEIDLHATEQRRRLYEHVMETRGRMPGALEGGGGGDEWGSGATVRSARQGGEGLSEDERKLTSLETLRLFSQILEVAEGKKDGEGEAEEGGSRRRRTQQQGGMMVGGSEASAAASSMDLLY